MNGGFSAESLSSFLENKSMDWQVRGREPLSQNESELAQSNRQAAL